MPTREEMRSLAREIVNCYEGRIATITQLRETVKADLKECQRSLKELQNSRISVGRELRADLAKSVADSRSAVSTELNEVRIHLKELGAANAAMSKELKAELAGERKDLAQGEKKRQGEVRKFMADLARAHGGGHDEWRKVTATMQAKRAGPTVETKRPAARKAASPPPGEE